MLLFNDLAPTVAARVEGCPHALIIEAIRDAAIEFCTRTRFHTTGYQVVLDGTEEPSFNLDEQVLDILQASMPDKPNACVHITYLNDPAADDIDTGDYVLRFVDANNFDITPEPTLAAPLTIDMVIALAPGPTATGVHEDLWRRHHETLRHGALARLFAESKKAWTDAEAANRHLLQFERDVVQAAAYAGRNRTQPGRRLRVKLA